MYCNTDCITIQSMKRFVSTDHTNFRLLLFAPRLSISNLLIFGWNKTCIFCLLRGCRLPPAPSLSSHLGVAVGSAQKFSRSYGNHFVGFQGSKITMRSRIYQNPSNSYLLESTKNLSKIYGSPIFGALDFQTLKFSDLHLFPSLAALAASPVPPELVRIAMDPACPGPRRSDFYVARPCYSGLPRTHWFVPNKTVDIDHKISSFTSYSASLLHKQSVDSQTNCRLFIVFWFWILNMMLPSGTVTPNNHSAQSARASGTKNPGPSPSATSSSAAFRPPRRSGRWVAMVRRSGHKELTLRKVTSEQGKATTLEQNLKNVRCFSLESTRNVCTWQVQMGLQEEGLFWRTIFWCDNRDHASTVICFHLHQSNRRGSLVM